MNPTIIALVNQKGSVGKSVTTVNPGVGLAQQGKHALVIDDEGPVAVFLSATGPTFLLSCLNRLLSNIKFLPSGLNCIRDLFRINM